MDPVRPTTAELAAFIGKYASQETASTVKIATQAGQLTLGIATAKPLALTPTFRNAFSMPAGDEVTGQPVAIYFRRDAAGKVTSFSAGDDRVWDLRFDRLR